MSKSDSLKLGNNQISLRVLWWMVKRWGQWVIFPGLGQHSW